MVRYTQVTSLSDSLSRQVEGLRQHFPLSDEIGAVLLLGSCSRGEATYRSDIDILIVLTGNKLTYGKVQEIRDGVEAGFDANGQKACLSEPLPVQFTVVLRSALKSAEPAMKQALLHKIVLADPHQLCS